MLLAWSRLSLLGALLLPTLAWSQRLSVVDFTGRGAGGVRSQLMARLCASADCVAANKILSAGKPDGKKAKRELLQYVVQGAVTRKGRTQTLEVMVLSVDRGTLGPKASRSFPLDARGLLAPKVLPQALEFLQGALREAAPEVPRPPPPAPVPSPDLAARAEPTPAPVAPPPVVSAPEPVPPPPGRPLVLAVELGSDVVNRSLTYAGNTSGNLRNYQVGVFSLPVARVEVYPLALAGPGLLSGLGLEGSFAFAPYLKSRVEGSTAEPSATTAMRIDGAVRWRIQPLSTYGLALIPFVGWRLQTFTVTPPAGAAAVVGLPNLAFSGLRAGLAVEVPVVGEVLTVLLRGAALPMFSSGEIISPAYLTAGSTFGLEASAGLAVQPVRWLQVRASFELTQYSLTFQSAATDTFQATGATDRYLGGNVSARLQL